MNEFALLIDGEFKKLRVYDEKPDDIRHKLVTWHSVIRCYGEPFEGLEGDVWVIRTVDPATLPQGIPHSITPRQCRLLLHKQNILAQVEAMVAQSTDDVKITWEYALEFRRDDPVLNGFAIKLQPPLTDDQIDQFFIAAAQL